MCCFSPLAAPARLLGWLLGPPRLRVSDTRIFGRLERAGEGATQWLVYSMSVATPADVAMVLPVPAARVAEDALSFIDLSAYHAFFTDLEALFPETMSPQRKGGALARLASPAPKPLVVHTVGSFEASYVPSLADFDRLDPRFRIPEQVWSERPEYRDFGFAVFKLKKGGKKGIHPMAFRFDTSETDAIFFPTLHVHDGELRERADFDHALFYQAPAGPTAKPIGPGEDRASPKGHFVLSSFDSVERQIDIERARGIVAGGIPAHKWILRGELPNRDARVWLARRCD